MQNTANAENVSISFIGTANAALHVGTYIPIDRDRNGFSGPLKFTALLRRYGLSTEDEKGHKART
jgi:hypothetical protein